MSPTAIELDGFDVSADDVIAVARQGGLCGPERSRPPASHRMSAAHRAPRDIPRRRLRSDDGLRCARFHQGVR